MSYFMTMAKMALAGTPEKRFKVGLRSLMRDKMPAFKTFERNMSPTIIDAALHHAWMQQVSLEQPDFQKGAEDVTLFCAEATRAYTDLSVKG